MRPETDYRAVEAGGDLLEFVPDFCQIFHQSGTKAPLGVDNSRDQTNLLRYTERLRLGHRSITFL